REVTHLWLWPLGHAWVNARFHSIFFRAAAAELALKRKLSFPVSRMGQRWVRRSSRAVVILASPKTVAHSLKLRLVVIATLVRSQSLLSRWNSNAPPEALNGRYPSSSRITRSSLVRLSAICPALPLAFACSRA